MWKTPASGGGPVLKPGEKFGDQQGARTLRGKKAFRLAHAGIGLERNLAKQLKYLDASESPHFIPDGVGAHRSENADGQTGEKIQLSTAGQRTRGQQQRQRGHRKTDLFREDPA